jgi:hypothetical protein
MFSYVEERSLSPDLDLGYHLAPWDRSSFRGNTAVLSSIRLGSGNAPGGAFAEFRAWCQRNDVQLVSCRLAHERLAECGFLEAQGFRFIELNYRPAIDRLDRFSGDPEILVAAADSKDAAELSAIAAGTFTTGRLHADPEVGPEIGNHRYAAWLINAFENPAQSVFKCTMAGRIMAYFVLEQPTPATGFWSLNGLGSGLAGQKLGRRTWQSMLAFHHRHGIRELSTSISSLNVAAFNLYVALGFRFPPPAITLHWCPLGPLQPPPS